MTCDGDGCVCLGGANTGAPFEAAGTCIDPNELQQAFANNCNCL